MNDPTPPPHDPRSGPGPETAVPDSEGQPRTVYKSHGGLRRIVDATGYSAAGLAAAWRHEAAFRQEIVVGVPLVLLAIVIAPGRWEALAMIASIVLVWVVELLNSAIEAVADAVTVAHHPLIGRAKDIGSAAVMFCLAQVAVVWGVALW